MAYLKKKALFFTTSPRTPSKMIPEIQLLAETFSGREWNKPVLLHVKHCAGYYPNS